MLDDASLSRQWVARRLQHALTMERWWAPLRHGLARRATTAQGQEAAEQALSSQQRAEELSQIIRSLGSEPYRSFGIGAPLARAAGWLVATFSPRLATWMGRHLVEHSWAEYEALAAFVEGATGVPAELAGAVAELRDDAARDARSSRENSAAAS